MRIELNLETINNKDVLIPYNYNYPLASAIYSKIVDLDFLNKLHESTSFKFFTFSKIFIKKVLASNKNGLIAKNGKIKFQISSPNKYFLTNFLNGCMENPNFRISNNLYKITMIKQLEEYKPKNNETFQTISPIISRTIKETNGKKQIWDLSPSDHFFRNLENNLIKKYNKFYNTTIDNSKIKITSEMRNVKEKRISIKKDNNIIYHRCYLMDITLSGDTNIIKFGYDTGIGEKNSMGFGMVKQMEKKKYDN